MAISGTEEPGGVPFNICACAWQQFIRAPGARNTRRRPSPFCNISHPGRMYAHTKDPIRKFTGAEGHGAVGWPAERSTTYVLGMMIDVAGDEPRSG